MIKTLFKVLFLLVFSQVISAAEGINGNLVTADWLNSHLNDRGIIILDASPAGIYNTKHIPGAINVDIFLYGSQELPAEEIEKLYQSWGISPDKKIIIYDQGGTIFATRQFFSLYYYGFSAEDLFILDGGLSKWEENNYPVTGEVPINPEHGSFKVKDINYTAKAELPEFLKATGDKKNNAVIEALGADWHYGEMCVFDKAGHIPNSVLMPGPDFYNSDKTFKSAEEIVKMLKYFKINPEQNIYTYCGGGISASVPYFALKFILHYPSVKLFTGSELAWLADDRELPYWTYDEPYLLRETKWLQFWGGKMLRMFGRSNISIIDIRPAEEFKKGHIQFAINIPAEIFRSNIFDLKKLSGILGQSGVNRTGEAVIVSGSGITKDAALVFLMLENLSQERISIFTDSMEKWQQLGYTFIKDSTGTAYKNTSKDSEIPPGIYDYNPRQDVILTDLNNSDGIYPGVLVLPATDETQSEENTNVHISYTELLTPDGTPGAAKDIWNIYSKAGLPRYAELICSAADPGEAAINYFFLKLMGYPDIRVLLNNERKMK